MNIYFIFYISNYNLKMIKGIYNIFWKVTKLKITQDLHNLKREYMKYTKEKNF